MAMSEKLLPLRQTGDGWWVQTVHYSKVPGYNFEAACVGMGADDIARELEISWDTTSGLRVYKAFSRERHVATEPLRFDPHRPLHIGWDCPGCPAVAITQLNAWGQWQIFPSLSPDEDQFRFFYQFAEFVADHLYREYAEPNGLRLEDLNLIHIGDPAGQYASPTTKGDKEEKASCYEILRRGVDVFLGEDENGKPITANKPGWGWNVIPGELRLKKRIEAVRARLTTLVADGLPAMIVDPRAEFVISLMLGGYVYEELPDGTYSVDPKKDHWSHTANALEYVATRLHTKSFRFDDEDEDIARREPFRSQAANRLNY